MSTIAVCDTEPVAIEGIRSLLGAHPGRKVIAAVGGIVDGIAMVRELRPSVLIVDRALGAPAVLDWLRLLRSEQSPTAVIVWGSAISESEALRYVQAGAGGVVRKTAPAGTLLTCVATVLGGGTWMEEGLLPEVELVVRTGHSSLTAREAQVLELVERGLKNREIAQSLGIQTGTVKIHLKHIFEKTGIRGRYGLALNGLKQKGLAGVTTLEF